VVIPVRNGGQAFRRCLEGVHRNLPLADEIIVVADGDTDGSRKVAEESGARVLAVPQPKGPAAARNIGARAAKGDVLLFVDADVVLPSDAVGRVKSAFRQRPELAAVFGSYDDDPPGAGFFSQYKNLSHHYVHQTSQEDASTFFAACGAIRRDAFEMVGGFSERYQRPCIEDIELGYRLKGAGKKVVLNKALQVKHLKEWSAPSLLRSDLMDRALPWTDLILRYHGLVYELNLRLTHRLSVAAAWVLVASPIGLLWWRGFLAVGLAMAIALIILNAPLYEFLRRRRGVWFMVKAIPWNWFFHMYSGLGFAVGLARHLLGRRAQDPVKAKGSEEEAEANVRLERN